MRAQVVLLQGDRILLARHESADRGYWVLPGGAVEPGETPPEAAIREVSEEAGLQVAIERLLFIDEPRADGAVVIRSPRYTYLGRIEDGELRCGEAGDGNPGNGRLADIAWMPFVSPEYDAATRDTLDRVRRSLESDGEVTAGANK